MRLATVTSFVAALAASASAEHTLNCHAKALFPPRWKVFSASLWFDRIIRDPMYSDPNLAPTVYAEAHRCREQYCHEGVSIRFCNDDDVIRYMKLQEIRNSVMALYHGCWTEYKGVEVAGGVIDHPDLWSVVVQTDDAC